MILLKILNYVLTIGAFFIIGFTSAALADSFILLVLLMISMGIIVLIHTIIHEAGHLVGGLYSGYEYVSFRIGSFVLIKDKENNCHLKKTKIPGTAGQCLMKPPVIVNNHYPYMLYHLSGGLMNIGIGLICLLLYYLLPYSLLSFICLFEMGIIGIAIGLMNLIPMKTGGIANDGMNVLDLNKNEEARNCCYLLLKLNGELTQIENYNQLDNALVNELLALDYQNLDVTNSLIGNTILFQGSLYFILGNDDMYYTVMSYLKDKPGVLDLFKNEARCECLYYEIIHQHQINEELYTKKLKQYIKQTLIYPSRLRLMYALYQQKGNRIKANEMYNKLVLSVDTYINKADALFELHIVNQLKEKE